MIISSAKLPFVFNRSIYGIAYLFSNRISLPACANHGLGGKEGLKGAVQPTCREGKAVIL
ncbi:MAG: hypothetical protein J6W28_08245 [Clostridia bacterium]|nr:hypothetical protein [Clostridia bacterium]